MGAQLESVFGTMERAPNGAKYDFKTKSGKTIDVMYTTDNLTQKEIDGLNKFFETNMTVIRGTDKIPRGQKQIIDHINKADVVPVDFRTLTQENQKIFLDFVNTLTPSEKAKILIVR